MSNVSLTLWPYFNASLETLYNESAELNLIKVQWRMKKRRIMTTLIY